MIILGLVEPPEGGGVLILEKGSDCGPTAEERWLLQPAKARKRGLSFYQILGKGSCQGQFN